MHRWLSRVAIYGDSVVQSTRAATAMGGPQRPGHSLSLLIGQLSGAVERSTALYECTWKTGSADSALSGSLQFAW